MNIRNHQTFKLKRQTLRKNQTEVEKLLWSKLRSKQFYGYKFYRQYSIGNYVLDFYCHSLKLGIELDGGQHNEDRSIEYDKSRTNYLNAHGVKVLRYWNNDILVKIAGVLEDIKIHIDNST